MQIVRCCSMMMFRSKASANAGPEIPPFVLVLLALRCVQVHGNGMAATGIPCPERREKIRRPDQRPLARVSHLERIYKKKEPKLKREMISGRVHARRRVTNAWRRGDVATTWRGRRTDRTDGRPTERGEAETGAGAVALFPIDENVRKS
jgi:hypothetical protein